jgi:hypothetical protein
VVVAKKPKQRTFDKHGHCPICSKLFEDCPHSVAGAEAHIELWNERSRVDHYLEPYLKRLREEITRDIEVRVAAAVAAEFDRRAAGGVT